MICLTGFEAFGPHEENPSQILLESLDLHSFQRTSEQGLAYQKFDSQDPDEFEDGQKIVSPKATNLIQTVILPVQYGQAFETVTREISDKTRVVIHFGVSARAKNWQLELYAHNLRYCQPIEEYPRGVERQSCVQGAVDLLESSMDVFGMLESLNRLVPAESPAFELSTSAGTYVCNDLYFMSLNSWRSSKKVVFVHIPPFSVMARECQEGNLNALIRWVLSEES